MRLLGDLMVKRIGLTLGFTLIEMAIVLVVIGLILSGGLVAVAPVIQNSKNAETNQKLDRIEQALIVHTIRYGCLPCPAAGATASTAAGVGQALDDVVYPSGCADNTCDAQQGVVPWVNLGLSEGDITDGFGSRISYAVDADLTGDTDMQRTPPSTYPGGDLIVQNNAGTELTGGTAGNRAAYVLIGHGSNRAFGFMASVGGAALTSPYSSSLEEDNSDGTPAYRQDDLNDNRTGDVYFDDLVRWRSAPMIIQLCGSNACGNPAL
jgi:prepilin-type N-terminal cleavage/methylation domain-containing protein